MPSFTDYLENLQGEVRELKMVLAVLAKRNGGRLEISEHDLVGIELDRWTVTENRTGLGRTFTIATTPAKCRVCGCTDDDCTQCVAKTGAPCHWVEQDLCSACA